MTASETKDGRLRVLLVDDDAVVRDCLAFMLSVEFEVTSAGSAEEALRALANADFHVLLSDYHMPGMPGAELLRRVATRRRAPSTILITGTPHMVEQLLAEEMDPSVRVVPKPFEPDLLMGLVDQLGRGAVERWAAAGNA